MAQYTITTNAQEDAALTFALAKHNAERANRTPPLAALDMATFVDNVLFRAVLISYRQQQFDEEATSVRTVYVGGTQAQRNAIKTAAGL